ncbi:MAG: hypothetical protein GX127_00185 [Eubacteriaceae bacterium]|jgi:hypothetical protein|nr:hypothetical protein [Eubacteriaceae bacterium]
MDGPILRSCILPTVATTFNELFIGKKILETPAIGYASGGLTDLRILGLMTTKGMQSEVVRN